MFVINKTLTQFHDYTEIPTYGNGKYLLITNDNAYE
jgi:hypothetical protein